VNATSLQTAEPNIVSSSPVRESAPAGFTTPPSFWRPTPTRPPLSRLLRRRLCSRAAAWYARRRLPRFGHVLDWLGVNHPREWINAPTAEIRTRDDGHIVRLDLSDFHQRLAYFMGGSTELELIGLLDAVLRPGDVFVDGGANIGLVSLHAAALVGPSGAVHAFEPLPPVFDELRWHAETNGLRQITCHNLGLSDAAGELTVQVPGWDNWGAGTLGPVPARYDGQVRTAGSVRVARLDDVLDPNDERRMVIKLDVEGFELRALRGMRRTLERRCPAVIAEILPDAVQLEARAGSPIHERKSTVRVLGHARL